MSMKRNNHKVEEIVWRVIRHFFEEDTGREQEELRRLLREPGLLNNAAELESRESIAVWLREPSRFSSREAYERFLGYCRERRRLRLRRWTRVAACVAFLLAGGGAWWMLGREGESRPRPVAQAITPITSKAYITLSTGEHIALGQKAETLVRDGSRIRQDSAVVSYSAPVADSATERKEEKVVYHELCVPRGGEYALVLSDSTRVWVNAASRLRYPVRFDGKREVYLLEGEAYFDVTRDERRPFVVHTPEGTVSVLGTEFDVNAYDGGAGVVTTLVEGSVRVAKAGRQVVLRPGEQLSTAGRDAWRARRVDVLEYVGWKNGVYFFSRRTLEELMEIVERNYDVTVFFANEDCKSLRFSGDLKKYDELGDFLRFIETGGDVRFVVADKTVTVYRK